MRVDTFVVDLGANAETAQIAMKKLDDKVNKLLERGVTLISIEDTSIESTITHGGSNGLRFRRFVYEYPKPTA
jgi:hypothetical protein